MTSRITLSSSTTNTRGGLPVDGDEPAESGASTSAMLKTVATLRPHDLAGMVTKGLHSLQVASWALEVAIL
jgi:hypothetical protein